ncbi:hypothetical protein N9Z27_02895 [Alphaproteobacteria bacterium]|nr:hypothetical protein [Alphaproteobacteria bacterium]
MGQTLLEGFKKFKTEAYDGDCSLMDALVKNGQDPEYFMISCVDSRGNPGTIFRPEPGTFFAHKAMGAIVRPYKQGTALAAALHFALTYNKVKTIIVLGHTQCGAVEALVNDLQDEEISSFVDVAQKSIRSTPRKTEEQIVLHSAENLLGYPSVAKALEEDRVKILPWLFDLEAGEILEFKSETEQFEVVSE